MEAAARRQCVRVICHWGLAMTLPPAPCSKPACTKVSRSVIVDGGTVWPPRCD